MRGRVIARRIVLSAALLAGGSAWMPRGLAQENSAPGGQAPAEKPAETPEREVIDLVVAPPPPATAAPPSAPAVVMPEVKIPNFMSCTIAELKDEVPELQKMKAAEDQSRRTAVLDKIGAKVVEMSDGTPNLVSDESVLAERNGTISRQNFSFLLLHHASKLNTVVVDEYRVDPASGEKFETDFAEDGEKSAEGNAADPRALELHARKTVSALSEAPHSTGFFSQWLNFYPANRIAIDYRYLGEEKIHGRQELIVAFAQKPGIYPLPLSMEDNGKTYKLYMQGVAWVDAKDFRIVRLRTGILSTPPGGLLRRFTVEVDFGETQVATISSPLWLPSRVVTTTKGVSWELRETHTYSHYRLFRAKSRMVLDR